MVSKQTLEIVALCAILAKVIESYDLESDPDTVAPFQQLQKALNNKLRGYPVPGDVISLPKKTFTYD